MTNTRIRVKIGAIEIEVEGTEEYVKSVVGEDIYETIDKLGEYKVVNTPVVPIEEDVTPVSPPSSGEIPSLAGIDGPSGCLRALLSSEWGKTPHAYPDIKDAFELRAKYFTDNTLTGAITRLVKKGDIRRVGRKGSFRYLGK